MVPLSTDADYVAPLGILLLRHVLKYHTTFGSGDNTAHDVSQYTDDTKLVNKMKAILILQDSIHTISK